ncbi:MAG: M42 family metallopeptidase [Clostridia bacterium]|nr:M42 family metallopeptidase [Clostridia bacterium]
MDNKNLLNALCNIDAPSGNEEALRQFILKEISDYCDAKVDKMGNIIAFKKGKNTPKYKVMLDAHLDEVGVIITNITESGMLLFDTVGGIETETLLSKRVRFGDTLGVIGSKPIHQSSADERKALPKSDSLYIDIGATDKDDALNYVSLGDIGTFASHWAELGESLVRSKALDDRVGCATLISLLKADAEYDFYATFTVGEEIGLRGAKTATYTVEPDFAIALEATSAADLHGSEGSNTVCEVGNGIAISFMDRATLYDRRLFDFALNTAKQNNISAQIKHAVTGGNNSGAIHLTKSGVKVITLSLPARYIHSPASVGSLNDFKAMGQLAKVLLNGLAAGEFN